ncbi:hypothetical protein CPZ26_020465 [Raoultella ornithinolytica]|nr:hypothetical protein CA210_21630 [Raoultella ornithinolytica]OWP39228.1 hypothetical protein CEG93_21280 [Raoultella ornithinolytica]OZV31796.1 hypothetical protein CA954_18205 [Raoultella ornithinolytica]OZV33446.1 hypothetical protein CA952_12280 [Raoultella ornithinolytica]OZV35067.1 hypothetical protein CA956_10570 [Raoultella ornithinolytica]
MVVFLNSCCHAHNIALFLVTKPITLVKKLFNTTNNISTSIVLLIKNTIFTQSKTPITYSPLLLNNKTYQTQNKTYQYHIDRIDFVLTNVYKSIIH